VLEPGQAYCPVCGGFHKEWEKCPLGIPKKHRATLTIFIELNCSNDDIVDIENQMENIGMAMCGIPGKIVGAEAIIEEPEPE